MKTFNEVFGRKKAFNPESKLNDMMDQLKIIDELSIKIDLRTELSDPKNIKKSSRNREKLRKSINTAMMDLETFLYDLYYDRRMENRKNENT